MVPRPAWAAGKISGPTEAAASVTSRSKLFFRVFIGMTMSVARSRGNLQAEDSLLRRNDLLVSTHLGQALKLLVQHARDHVDFFVVELLDQTRCFSIPNLFLPPFIFFHK